MLGKHRLLCGDSSKPEDVDRLLDGASIHLVNTDPPYNVKVEPRSNNAIAAGLSSFQGNTHHQGLDLARHPEKAQPTEQKLRAKDRPLANDFVTDEEFDRLLQAWFGNMARVLQPGRGFYIWGGYANCGNYPPVLKAARPVLLPGHHLGQGAPGADAQGLHGLRLRWCFYGWNEGAAHQFFGPEQRHRPVGRQEGQPAEHGPSDREARRAGGPGDGVLVPARARTCSTCSAAAARR